MAIKKISNLISDLLPIINDYKGGDIITNNRIEKWISQFSEKDQTIILEEMIHIFKSFYISKKEATNFLEQIFSLNEIFGEDFFANKSDVKFLNIQSVGGSQAELLDLIETIANDSYGISLDDCGSNPSKYIYVDDCLFSGNRVRRDIEAWIDEAKEDSELHLVFLGIHIRNLDFISHTLEEMLKKKNMKFKFWRVKEISDSRKTNYTKNNKYECLWAPYASYGTSTERYIEDVEESRSDSQRAYFPLLREEQYPINETLFTSKEHRDIVEKAFFEKGVYIKSFGNERKENIRALGYDNNKTLGFGSMFVTYRNIANNCPLVLWWGDENATPGLGDWYPLFPRTVN